MSCDMLISNNSSNECITECKPFLVAQIIQLLDYLKKQASSNLNLKIDLKHSFSFIHDNILKGNERLCDISKCLQNTLIRMIINRHYFSFIVENKIFATKNIGVPNYHSHKSPSHGYFNQIIQK